jgi:hypothetical protein
MAAMLGVEFVGVIPGDWSGTGKTRESRYDGIRRFPSVGVGRKSARCGHPR